MERNCNFNICPKGFGQAGPPLGRICRVQGTGVVIETQPYHQETLCAITSLYIRHGKTLEGLGIKGGFI